LFALEVSNMAPHTGQARACFGLRRFACDRLYAAWHVVAMTGMRRGELLGLAWSALDLDAGRLAITQEARPAGTIGRG
jgi:integrase